MELSQALSASLRLSILTHSTALLCSPIPQSLLQEDHSSTGVQYGQGMFSLQDLLYSGFRPYSWIHFWSSTVTVRPLGSVLTQVTSWSWSPMSQEEEQGPQSPSSHSTVESSEVESQSSPLHCSESAGLSDATQFSSSALFPVERFIHSTKRFLNPFPQIAEHGVHPP